MLKEQITLTPNEANQRLDRFCRKRYKVDTSITLGTIYQRIRTGDIRVNGKKKAENYVLKIHEVVTFPPKTEKAKKRKTALQPQEKELSLEEIKKMIIFEDADRIIRNKPVKIVIHANQNTGGERTMHQIMETYRRGVYQPGAEIINIPERHFCYRLDRDTSGVLVAAKNLPALQHLNELIRERNVEKKYCAIVAGDFPAEVTIDSPLQKVLDMKFNRGKMKVSAEGGKESLTHARGKKTWTDPILGQLSFVEVSIETGRMHQIRIHLASIGHPILGDLVYGIPSVNRKFFDCYTAKYHLLHCTEYSFPDLTGKKNTYKAELPAVF